MPRISTAKKAATPSISVADAISALSELYGPFPEEPRLDPIHELVFTILSQHTSDINSERAFRQLMQRFGGLDAVAEIDYDPLPWSNY